jgi:hypothetical protein
VLRPDAAAAGLDAALQPGGPVTGGRTFEISLSDDDAPHALGGFFDPETPQFCGPCQTLVLGPTTPRSIVLTWTADLTLYAWVEGDGRNGVPVIIEEQSVGSRFGEAFGKLLRITRGPAWDRVGNPRMPIGIPLTEPRMRLGASVPIMVTVVD